MNTPSPPTLTQRFFALLRYFFKRKCYPSKKSFFIRLLTNFVIIILIIVFLHMTEDLVFFKELKNLALDNIMYWQSDFEPTLADGKKIRRMALIRIDDKAYYDWGFPVTTPRDKLKELIEKAVQGGANVIAVDIELSQASDGCIHTFAKPQPACSPASSGADKVLADYLRDINEHDTAPPVILTGMYRKPLKKNGTINNEAFFERQASFLDEVLKEEKNVFWASSFFVIDEDRIWRRWQLAPLVCQDGHLTVVPSIQLLTALAELHTHNGDTRPAAPVIRDLKIRLNNWAKQFHCDIKEKTIAQLCRTRKNCPDFRVRLPLKKRVSDKAHVINLAAEETNKRIVYRFAPPDTPNPKQRTIVDIDSAQQVLTYGSDVQNKIVFIGLTHQDSGDRHPIPIRVLTDVDGVYIVANATDTLLRFGGLQSQSPQSTIIIAIVLAVFMTLIFTVFNAIPAHVMSLMFLVVSLFWTFYQLRYGIIMNVSLYSLTVQISQAVVNMVTQAPEIFDKIKRISDSDR